MHIKMQDVDEGWENGLRDVGEVVVAETTRTVTSVGWAWYCPCFHWMPLRMLRQHEAFDGRAPRRSISGRAPSPPVTEGGIFDAPPPPYTHRTPSPKNNAGIAIDGAGEMKKSSRVSCGKPQSKFRKRKRCFLLFSRFVFENTHDAQSGRACSYVRHVSSSTSEMNSLCLRLMSHFAIT